MPKKLRYKDIREDEFQKAVTSTTGQAVDVYRKHRWVILGAVAAVLVAGAVIVGLVARTRAQEREAQVKLGKALDAHSKAEAALSTTTSDPAAPSWDDVIAQLDGVIRDHPKTTAATLAEHWRGVAQLRAGRTTEAVESLTRFSQAHADEWSLPHALSALATAQEEAGSVEDAAATWQRLADTDWRTYPRAAALYNLARLHERTGNVTAAREAYEKLANDEVFSESAYSSQARAALAKLGAT